MQLSVAAMHFVCEYQQPVGLSWPAATRSSKTSLLLSQAEQRLGVVVVWRCLCCFGRLRKAKEERGGQAETERKSV